jgi:hypothetical protein
MKTFMKALIYEYIERHTTSHDEYIESIEVSAMIPAPMSSNSGFFNRVVPIF